MRQAIAGRCRSLFPLPRVPTFTLWQRPSGFYLMATGAAVSHSIVLENQRWQPHMRRRHFSAEGRRPVPSAAKLEKFLGDRGFEYRVSNEEYLLRECPYCPPHKDDPSNLFKLSYNLPKDLFYCFRCQSSGKWIQLHAALTDSSDQATVDDTTYSAQTAHRNVRKIQPEAEEFTAKLRQRWAKYSTDLLADKSKPLLSYLCGERGLTKEVLQAYGVGAKSHLFYNDGGLERLTMAFPQDEPDSSGEGWQTVRVKLRSLAEKRLMLLEPARGKLGFFGWRTVSSDTEEIVLTEGEFDAMSVYQATRIPTLSLPNGANGLREDLIGLLDRFDRIILWTDNDEAGRKGREKLVQKLGRRRCLVVLPRDEFDDLKDANAALLAGVDLSDYIQRASPLPHAGVMKLADIEPEILHEIQHPTIVPGVPIQVFPGFNALIKGLRKGELTILTGRTGVGKTTFLSQLSLDWCMSGVKTLWGTFEVDRLRFSMDMLYQYVGRTDPPFEYPSAEKISPLESHNATRDFAKLPMLFLSYHGPTAAMKVLDAMDHSIEVDGVQHIVLDNLQFLVGDLSAAQEDGMLSHLRKLASERNVHITLVVHPRRESEKFLLEISDLPGSGKIIQEADNILILQRYQDGSQSIQVKKNRYDGDIGEVPLKFMKSCKSYVDISPLAEHMRLTKPGDIIDTMGPPPTDEESCTGTS